MFNSFPPIIKYWLIFSSLMFFLCVSSVWETSQLSSLNVLAYPVLNMIFLPNGVSSNSYHTCMISQIYHITCQCFTQILESLILFSNSERGVSWKWSEGSVMTFLFEGSPLYTVLPCSGLIQWVRGGCGAKAHPLAARPELFLVGRGKRVWTWLHYRSLGHSWK